MPDKLSLSRAARLANVSRGELQARLKALNLNIFEGAIRTADLLTAYPEIDMDSDPVLERVALIREEAFAKRGRRDTALPSPEVLMSRLQDFQTVLTKTKAQLNLATELVQSLRDELETALHSDPDDLRPQVERLVVRLSKAIPDEQRGGDREAALFAKNALLSLMSATVKLQPSGHEFFVIGQDSILEAGVKAGLHLNYGCASGNCGECKVRLLSGRTQKIRDFDYVMSAQEREQGYLLACSHTAVTDLRLEACEALCADDLPRQQIRTQVRKHTPLGQGRSLLQVQTPRTQTLRFMAGQRVRLIPEHGEALELAIASCPCDARHLQFVVPAEQADAQAGSRRTERATITLEGPFGDFLLAEESPAPAVFVAVGDGIAPIKSLIEHAVAIDHAVTLYLLRIDDLAADSPIGNLCRSWHDALDNFNVEHLPATAGAADALSHLLQHHAHLAGCELYVSAPQAWLEGFQNALSAATGLTPAGVHLDAIDRPIAPT